MNEFKTITGEIYHIIAIAKDTETEEEIVVCQTIDLDNPMVYIVPQAQFDKGQWFKEKSRVPEFATSCAYRHFKGNLYYALALGYNIMTKQFMVVYQALYGDHGYFVRNLSMFVEDVPDKKQSENITGQTCRFERFEGKNIIN